MRQVTQGQLLLQLSQATPNNGLLRLNTGRGDCLLATNAAVLGEILIQHPYDFEKPAGVRNFMRHFLGDGLILVEGERHKLLRRSSLKALGFRQIQDMYPMMWAKAVKLQDHLDTEVSRRRLGEEEIEVEMFSLASKVTIDVIGMAGLGRDFNLLEGARDQLAEDYETVTGPSMLLYFVCSVWFSFDLVQMLPWDKNRVFRERTQSMHRICHELVQTKRREMDDGVGEHFDILSQLIKTGEFTDDDLANQLLTYLVAGHDTAAATLTWVCFLLAKHPAWQEKLRLELLHAGSPITEPPDCGQPLCDPASIGARLERLPVLNGVLNESLRHYPTVPVTTRVAARTTALGGWTVPQGTEVLISPWLFNYSPELWGAEANAFDPGRWIAADGRPNNSGGATSNYALMTFLHGPRNCIGQDFAKAELRCLLAAVASRFEWTLGMDERKVVPAGAITIRPKDGLLLKMKPIARG